MNSTPTFAQVAAVEYAREETRSKAEELKRRLDIANDALADAEMRAEEAEAATEAYKHEMALEVEAEAQQDQRKGSVRLVRLTMPHA